ncbi:MAG: VOC family protein [Paracoccaceae bacterium]
MSGIRGVNHITLACSDIDRGISFYTNRLNGVLRAQWNTGAYLELGDLWLCLDAGPVTPGKDYTHIALDCAADDFPALSSQIKNASKIWKENRSEGSSLYFLDPDAHRLELHVGTLDSRLAQYAGCEDVTIFSSTS